MKLNQRIFLRFVIFMKNKRQPKKLKLNVVRYYATQVQACGHGFRSSARTILEEVLEFPIELIEQQLAHQVKDIHGRAYNRTKHLEKIN